LSDAREGTSEGEVVELLGAPHKVWRNWWFRVPLAGGGSVGGYVLSHPRDASKPLRGYGIQSWSKWRERLHAEGEAGPEICTRQVAPRIVSKERVASLTEGRTLSPGERLVLRGE